MGRLHSLTKRLFAAPQNSPVPPSPPFAPVWQNVSLNKADYEAVYVQTIRQHHALDPEEFGVRIDYAMLALTVRKAFFLPPGTPPERLHIEDDMWTFAVFLCALLDGSRVANDPWKSVSDAARSWLREGPVQAIEHRVLGRPSAIDDVFNAIERRVLAQAETAIQHWCKAHVEPVVGVSTDAFTNGEQVLIRSHARDRLAESILTKGMALNRKSSLTSSFLAEPATYRIAGLEDAHCVSLPLAVLGAGQQPGPISAFEVITAPALLMRVPAAQRGPGDIRDERQAIKTVMDALRVIAALPTEHAINGPSMSLVATSSGVFVSDELWRAVLNGFFGASDVELAEVWPRDNGNRYTERRITDQSYQMIGSKTGGQAIHVRDAFYVQELTATAKAIALRHVDQLNDKELRTRFLKFIKSVDCTTRKSGLFALPCGAFAITLNKGITDCARKHLSVVGKKRAIAERLAELIGEGAEVKRVIAPNSKTESALVIAHPEKFS